MVSKGIKRTELRWLTLVIVSCPVTLQGNCMITCSNLLSVLWWHADGARSAVCNMPVDRSSN